MLDTSSIAALAHIRSEFEASTPAGEYPAAVSSELLLLWDVTVVLGADDAGQQAVLGDAAWQYVNDLTGGPL